MNAPFNASGAPKGTFAQRRGAAETAERRYRRVMCRNITELRGLEPAATAEEIEAAARQYVRKVSGIQKLSDANREPFEEAVAVVTEATTKLLAALPPRKQPPQTVPPLRRPEVRARIAAKAASSS